MKTTPSPRRFPPPWRVVEIPAGFVVEDANGVRVAYCYAKSQRERGTTMESLTIEEARKIANGIAQLPDLMRPQASRNKAAAARAAAPVRVTALSWGSVMAAYMIVQIKITREAAWPEYRRRVAELFERHGARFLVRAGPVEALEGSYDGRRLIVIEFPSMEVIRSVWHSPEYAEIKALREGAGVLDVWAVPGV